MSGLRFDTYYRHEELTRHLHDLAKTHPGLLRLHSVGRSYEGRDIWLATVTNFGTGPDQDKPALWVDGNIHAAELAGSSACLLLLQRLLNGYGQDPDTTRCLDTRAFYVCPRVNPDGAEWALADRPRLIRSSTRPYPYPEAPLGGLVTEDIDGDGRILTMRIPDPDGHWKISPQEPRLMIPRDPVETGGQYYRLLPEGRLEDYDGVQIRLQPRRERLDLNRNFPAQWREEHEQPGAGTYPTSEPEVRAIVDFIAAHPNICAGVAFHTYSGALLRAYSYKNDEELPAEDLWTYQKIGAEGTARTGYPAVSTYHEFRYHPKEVITGALDDWLYDNLGVFAWTVEIWSPQRQAGITEYKFLDWYRDHPFDHDLKLLAWNDAALAGRGYVDWYAFEHPQLGRVELGGWNPLYTFYNPPPSLLEQEIARFPDWLVWHNLLSPRLELHQAAARALGNDLYEITLAVKNTGWLPSYVTKTALNRQRVRGVICEIDLPAQARLISGKPREEIGQLEGRAYKPSSPTGWAGYAADPTEDRALARWVVHAPAGGCARLTARHDRAGTVRTELTLSQP